MESPMKKVLITGATGRIAGQVLPELRKLYDLVLLDKKKDLPSGETVADVIVTDLLNRDRDTYREHFRGVDAVIHSGFVRSPSPEQAFWAELDNVAMAYNIYQTCVEENVPRILVVSSNHAADFYEPYILDGDMLSIGPDTPAYSDNFYGWAKVAYEALGLVFAVGKINGGKKLPNVQFRIGAPRETDIESCKVGDRRKLHRDLGAYMSLRDEVQIIRKSLETENIDNKFGIPFQIFYGVSGNTFNFWDIGNAKKVIGYEPQDDALERFSDHVTRILGIPKG
jgi:hypothetical protein